jgi:small subunit ribosomal protein S4
MSKRLAAKHKIDRRYGVNLWGRAKSPVNTRNSKPGQHGQKMAAKLSDYGLQLAAKQKLRGFYGSIVERQFRRFYREAARLPGDTGENFITLLERRLDAVIYHMKFAPTIFAARQLVNHGHVLVNGKRVDIPSYLVSEGDEVKLSSKASQMGLVLEALQSGERETPDYMSVDTKKCVGSYVRYPKFADVPYPIQIEPNLIVEWYSRRV